MATKNTISTQSNLLGYIKKEECPFIRYCRQCRISRLKSCCLYLRFSQNNLKRCYDLECVNSYDCIDAIERKLSTSSIPKIKEIFLDKYQIKTPLLNFKQNFIPRIDISPPKYRKEQINIIKNNNLDILAVSLQDIISEKEGRIIKKNYNGDLHNIISFNGKIVLLTNIFDYLCEKLLRNIDDYILALESIRPDIITTFDANFYINQPLFISAYQINRIIEANKKLDDLGIFQIGLVPPSPYFEKTLEFMLKSNYKVIGIPLSEINRDRDFELRNKLINTANRLRRKFKFKILLISTNPNKKLSVDYFISQSWVKLKNAKLLNLQQRIILWEKNFKKCIENANKAKKNKTLYEWM